MAVKRIIEKNFLPNIGNLNVLFCRKIILMETIIKRLEQQGYDRHHPDYEILIEILITVKMLKETVEPFISNDPVKHRVNLNIRGRLIHFLACQDDEYYLRKAAKLLNEKDAESSLHLH
jgi:hypothetical protein